jgi:hypothetical protein
MPCGTGMTYHTRKEDNRRRGYRYDTELDFSTEREKTIREMQYVREVSKPITAGYRDFIDSLCIPSNGCRPDSFLEGESRMKMAAA